MTILPFDYLYRIQGFYRDVKKGHETEVGGYGQQ